MKEYVLSIIYKLLQRPKLVAAWQLKNMSDYVFYVYDDGLTAVVCGINARWLYPIDFSFPAQMFFWTVKIMPFKQIGCSKPRKICLQIFVKTRYQ